MPKPGRVTNEKTAGGYLSRAMGCHPSQVKEFNESYRKHGVTAAQHRPDGTLEITGRGETGRAGVMKLRGMVDKDGGYGDHTG